MSLRLRLLLTLAPLFIIGLAAADFGTYAALQSSLVQNVDTQLLAIEHGAENVLENPGAQQPFPGGGDPGNSQLPPGTYGELLDASGPLTRRRPLRRLGFDNAIASDLAGNTSIRREQQFDLHADGPWNGDVGVVPSSGHARLA